MTTTVHADGKVTHDDVVEAPAAEPTLTPAPAAPAGDVTEPIV